MNIRYILAGVALAGLTAAPAAAQKLELKFGHVGNPGSLFESTVNEFARCANESLAGKAEVQTFGSSQLGNGLSKIADRVFRIGHLGDFNDLMLAGTLSGVEMGLELSGVPYNRGGVQAALDYLSAPDQAPAAEAAAAAAG